MAMRKIWNMVWDLMMQFPQEEVFMQATGGGSPIMLTRREIQGNFDIIPVGAVGFGDPAFKTQKALARLQVLMQAAPLVAQSPEFEVNLGEALVDYLEEDDVNKARLIVRRRSPEEVQQIMQAQQEQARIQQQVDSNIPSDPAEMQQYIQMQQSKLPHGKFQRMK